MVSVDLADEDEDEDELARRIKLSDKTGLME